MKKLLKIQMEMLQSTKVYHIVESYGYMLYFVISLRFILKGGLRSVYITVIAYHKSVLCKHLFRKD